MNTKERPFCVNAANTGAPCAACTLARGVRTWHFTPGPDGLGIPSKRIDHLSEAQQRSDPVQFAGTKSNWE